jgi:pimeloyl-ACP methyl ester carboxylesterase
MVPVGILRGECDFKRWEVTHDYKQTFPNATLLYVTGAGHVISSDQPDIYLAALRAFLLDRPLLLEPYQQDTPPK